MKPEDKELAEQVIEFFKNSEKSKLGPFRDLAHIITDRNKAEKILYPLELDFGLIERSGSSSFRLTQKGWDFKGFADLEKDEMNRKLKEQIEFRKTQIDLELSEKILKEYPKTKWFARIGLFIAIVLAMKEIYIWLMQQ